MSKINVKLKDTFHKPFLVTLRGNQFIKNEITEVDLEDAEVQSYLLTYEKHIEIIETKKEKVKEQEKEKVEEQKKEKVKEEKKEKVKEEKKEKVKVSKK